MFMAYRSISRPALIATALIFTAFAQAQRPEPAISIAGAVRQNPSLSLSESRLSANSHALDYREFAPARAGAEGSTESFTLNFHQASTLKSITATFDFHVTGGTCIEGHTYSEGNACSVDVAFHPTGPGHRTGALSITHSASAIPMLTPIGGTAYAPVVSFIPSEITTVPGTYSSGGTLSNPKGLAVDGGDNLYIADTGNHLIKKIDSSGTLKTLIGGGSNSLLSTTGFGPQIKLNAPYGVAVDYTGTVYFTDEGDFLVGVYYLDNIANRLVGGGSTNSTSCSPSSPCTSPSNLAIGPPMSIAVDSSANLFFSNLFGGSLPGATLVEATTNPLGYFQLGNTAYNYYSQSYAVGTDPFGYGNLYYTYDDPGTGILSPTPLCYILGQNSAISQEASGGKRFWTVAGAGTCGFSGDGGQATGAEIGGTIGAFAWDAAGNLYFTDTANNRVRRVDGTTGFIYTVAGNGSIGLGGDGGPATTASLNTPFGLAVDSQGRVYFTNLAGTSPNAEVRVVGTQGAIAFGSTNVSTASAVKTILLSNTGNETLYFTRATISSGNASDFAIDPNTTSCNFSGYIQNGQSCTIGVIFTPSAAGARSAVLTVLDNTVVGSNLIQLSGTGASSNPAKASLSPTSEAFNSEPVGTASGTRTLTLSNTGGATMTISSYTFTGSNTGDFTQTHTCGSTLAAAATCNISVIFDPTASGARSATLSVATTGGTVTASLTGTGAAAATVSISPTSYTFPSQAVGTSSTAKAFTVTNNGTTTLTFNTYGFTGTNAADFIQAHPCGTTLAAAASCIVNVAFKPSATGTRTANLSIVTTAGTLTVPLTGTAVAAAVKPKVTLATRTNPAANGQTAVLTSTVAATAGEGSLGAEPTGKVELMEGSKVVATVSLINGTATFQRLNLAPGKHTLTASYLGDTLHPAAKSTPVQQVVGTKTDTYLP